MIAAVLAAFVAGLLVSLSRQVNGRLSLATSAMGASFWNHLVGAVALSLAALASGGLIHGDWTDPPALAWLGGTVGVVFVAANSWLIVRIGAVATALLVIGGNMISSVALDLVLGAPGDLLARAAGVALILGGMVLTLKR